MSPLRRRLRARLLATLAAGGLALAGCAGEPPHDSSPSSPGASGAGTPATEPPQQAREVSGPSPRLVATYDGGILTLDAGTLDLIDDSPLDGFNRLNPLGDDRGVLVSTQDGFRVFDAGTWSEPHGDHSHSFVSSPRLTDVTLPTRAPGHVVSAEGRTLLFGDGDGSIRELSPSRFRGTYDTGETPEVAGPRDVAPHHGVAVPLPGGGMLRTEGTREERHTAVVEDAAGTEVARSENCPGVHGEALASTGAVTVGCEDGILIYRDGDFTKVASPDGYGRIGNQAGSDRSAVVLGDYKVDRGAEVERPTRITLTDTAAASLQIIDLPASYSFRSLGRGPEGEALVLGTDGALRVIDPDTGAVTGSIPVVAPWEESPTWQDPRPTLFVLGKFAYVTEPATRSIHKVDIPGAAVVGTAELPHTPNELTGVAG